MNDHSKEFQTAILNPQFRSDFEKMRTSRDAWRIAAFVLAAACVALAAIGGIK